MEKRIQSRIIQKHATEVEWNSSSLIPLQGELIIYDADSMYPYQRFKVGDGVTVVSALPFILHNPLWVGTREQYNLLNAKGQIPIGTVVILLDEELNESDGSTAVLGVAVLGQLKLGTN